MIGLEKHRLSSVKAPAVVLMALLSWLPLTGIEGVAIEGLLFLRQTRRDTYLVDRLKSIHEERSLKIGDGPRFNLFSVGRLANLASSKPKKEMVSRRGGRRPAQCLTSEMWER